MLAAIFHHFLQLRQCHFGVSQTLSVRPVYLFYLNPDLHHHFHYDGCLSQGIEESYSFSFGATHFLISNQILLCCGYRQVLSCAEGPNFQRGFEEVGRHRHSHFLFVSHSDAK